MEMLSNEKLYRSPPDTYIMTMKRVCHLCMWIVANIYRFLKRRPALIALLAVAACGLVLTSFQWGLVCSNTQPHYYIKEICKDYQSGLSIGNLCDDLCELGEITSISCQRFYMGKEVVFSGVQGNRTLFFKLARKHPSHNEPLHWWDSSSKKMYPSEADFSSMIMSSVKLRFNLSLKKIEVENMFYNNYALKGSLSEIEMESVWYLLQQNEYLALLLYAKFDIFPQLVGSCGLLYAVPKLTALLDHDLFRPFSGPKKEWVQKVKLAVMILDFLLRLEKLPETLCICDVKLDHFGVTADSKKIQYLDVDFVYPLSVTNQITGDGSPCKQHSDCDYFDCRSFCNLITYKCQHGVVNNNLQIVCEKIFLGLILSGRLMSRGLLMGPWAPKALVDLVQLCANPDGETGTPRSSTPHHVMDQLHKLLSTLSLS